MNTDDLETTEVDGIYYYSVIDQATNWSISVVRTKSIFYLESPNGNDLSIHAQEIDVIIALLQKAREIMGGV